MTAPTGFITSVRSTLLLRKKNLEKLTPRKTTPFAGRQPGDYSHWNSEPSGPWKPVSPHLVIEVRYDHFTDQRFRHGCTFLRSRPDKVPVDCVLGEQASPLRCVA